jgi:LPS export ABC transporter permease LptG
VYFAQEGRLVVNREQRTVVLELRNGTRHTTSLQKAEEYEGGNYGSVIIQLDPDTVFPKSTINRSVTEMSIADLEKSIAEGAAHHDPGNLQRFMIQQKFAIPAASLVLAMIGLALGVSHRKDGRLASFALGFGVIFTYYVILWTSRAAAITGRFPAGLAPWIPNAVFSVAGVALLLWRSRSADQPIRLSLPALPAFLSRRSRNPLASTPASPRAASRRRVVLVIRIPHIDWPRPTLLDVYVSSQYIRIFFLGLVSLLGVFYISTFMDLADKLFRGSATSAMLLRYFYFQTPQYVYYIIPMSALVATLVTIGLMTKNSELVVMRACGISLYRTALPLLIFGLGASAVLFGLQERVIAFSNREADRLNRTIRGLPPQSFGALDRRWLVGENGDVYHYDLFDSKKNEFTQFTVHRMSTSQWGLASMLHAERVVLVREKGADGRIATAWHARKGWSRTFTTTTTRDRVSPTAVAYVPFEDQAVSLEPPGYFKSDEPDAALMTYGELKDYAAKLSAGGFNVIPELVALQRKVAFPFVTVVMTLLAVPFAVSTGRRGALYGVGIGIVLAIVYWLMVSIFGAVGSGGILSPVLAAWAPNILFSAAALYMILTVRT